MNAAVARNASIPGQMVLDFSDVSIMPRVKAMLKLIPGIKTVRVKKAKPAPNNVITPELLHISSAERKTLKAMEEVKNGGGIVCNTWNEFLEAIK